MKETHENGSAAMSHQNKATAREEDWNRTTGVVQHSHLEMITNHSLQFRTRCFITDVTWMQCKYGNVPNELKTKRTATSGIFTSPAIIFLPTSSTRRCADSTSHHENTDNNIVLVAQQCPKQIQALNPSTRLEGNYYCNNL